MKKILIVDDSPTNLQFVESVLNDKYKLALAKSGERAIKFLEKNKVDLILLDIMMPEMDGFETFECIKQYDSHDLSACDKKILKWKNLKSGNEGTFSLITQVP